MGYIRLYDPPECDKCYQITGTVNSLSSASESISLGIIDWNLVFSGQALTAISNLLTIQTIEFTSTGAFNISIDIECVPFLFTQLQPNIIFWNDADIDIEIDTFQLTEACQTEICSECFELIDCGHEYLLIEASSDSDAFGIKYEGVGKTPINFNQQMLVPGILEPLDYPYPEEEIFKYGNGDKKPILTDSEETHEMITKMIPDYMHDSLRLLLKHENLTINGKPAVKLDGTYTPEIDRTDNLASQVAVDIQILKQDKNAGRC